MSQDAGPIPPASSGSYPLRDRNAVAPLVDGAPAFRRICEAVEQARSSVWVTVAFIETETRMPGGHGTFFELLDRAAGRGVDVRVLFWREPEITRQLADAAHFEGTAAERAWLRDRRTLFLARWDRVPGYCHHQKSWIIDAGRAGETAFVGGINLTPGSMAWPGHPPIDRGREGRNIHDLYLEVRGAAATDVHHNFVQRWNGASERGCADGCFPDAGTAADLAFPRRLSPPAGEVPVQITRTVRRGCYQDGTPAPGGTPFAIASGERSILEQYLRAIGSARRSAYFENQLLLCPDILGALEDALARGVEVVFLVPGVAMPEIIAARARPEAIPVFRTLDALGRFPGFTMAGIAANRGAGRYEDIYVHAKAAIIDDAWCTIGSANTMFRSMKGDTELNATFWDAPAARALRCRLLREHLDQDTSALDGPAALRRYRQIALQNRDRRSRGEPLQGQAFWIDPARWAT